MDSLEVDIIRKILYSSDEIWKEIESSDEWKILEKTNQFPLTNNVLLNAVSSSLKNILSYKVSRSLHQRYEVRTCIIEILRSWSRVQGSLSNLNITFSDGEKSMKFITHFLEKHLTDELLKDTESVDLLLALYRALKCLLSKNPSLSKYLNNIILRLANLELTDDSEKLLISITELKEDVEVDSCVLEQVYSSQRIKFIEKPLSGAFVSIHSTLEDLSSANEQFLNQKLGNLIGRIVQSPLIFRLTSSLLKEIFVAVNYSQEGLNFTQLVLQCIIKQCKIWKKDIVDLYPVKLQSCVILLRIHPDNHSKNSKVSTMKTLTDIFLRCNEDALILVSHYPAWLEIFSSFLIDNGYDLPSSQENFNICD